MVALRLLVELCEDIPKADTQQLLQEIHDCPVATSIRNGQSGPCQTIVLSQTGMTFHSPEPWSRQIATAPILFLSSNPSISEEEIYPEPSWGTERITEFFQNRFDSPSGWVDSHLCALKRDGARTGWVRYWAAARARVSELSGKPKAEIKVGVDFALTEVVHCKSRGQKGVFEALDFCSENFLDRVLSMSAAHVIVVYGEHAKYAVHGRYGPGITKQSWPEKLAEFRIGGRSRILVFLPAPNARNVPKTLIANIESEGISIVRSYLESKADSAV
jgi:hypothetical protein